MARLTYAKGQRPESNRTLGSGGTERPRVRHLEGGGAASGRRGPPGAEQIGVPGSPSAEAAVHGRCGANNSFKTKEKLEASVFKAPS